MLEIKGLTKRYSRITAVDNVSFRIEPGEVYGYLGPNGSGKSTTVKMLTGLLEPSAGGVFFKGRDIRADLRRIPPSAWATFPRSPTSIPT